MAAYRVFPFVAPVRLFGDAVAAAAAAAALAIEKAMQAAASGAGVPTGDLTPVAKTLTGDAQGAGVAAGALDTSGSLIGAARADTIIDGQVEITKTLVGEAVGAATTIADLTAIFGGSGFFENKAPSPWPGRTVAPGLSIYSLRANIEVRGVW